MGLGFQLVTMSVLLAVAAHAKVQDAVNRHLYYWQRTGRQLLGIHPKYPLGAQVEWPDDVETCEIGQDGNIGLVFLERFLDQIKHCCMVLRREGIDRACLTEYDQLILDGVPEVDVPFMAERGINKEARFRFENYWLPPWIFTADSGEEIVKCGERLLKLGEIEHGFQDRFIALVVHKLDMPVRVVPRSLTRQFEDMPESYFWMASEAVERGEVNFIHKIKTEYQFSVIQAADNKRRIRNGAM